MANNKIKLSDFVNLEDRKKKMKIEKIFISILVCLSLFLCHGCAFLAGTAAGGAGGYILRDQGYEVQSPVKKE